MATWRRRALADFPDRRAAVADPEFSIYQLFFELLPEVRAAHEREDEPALERIYGFAAWSFAQADLTNAAAVAFYEHLFGGPSSDDERIVARLSPEIIRAVWPLWEARLDPPRLAKVRRLVGR